MHQNRFDLLNSTIIQCKKCPRLVQHRENVPPRASYRLQTYWRKPVPGFGDPNAWLLLTGLAPSAQGGNRTGRIFTGDESARFLMNALFNEGFSNQPTSEHLTDGLQLFGCYMTAAVKCVPPSNLPTLTEIANCNCYFQNELFLLKNITTFLALGNLAFNTIIAYAKSLGHPVKHLHFRHGAKYCLPHFPTIFVSYHPSPQNTNTGKLTQEMFQKLLREIKEDHVIYDIKT